MTMTHYERTTHAEETRVTGGDVGELRVAAGTFHEPDTAWHIDGDSVVFVRPMGSQLIQRAEDAGPTAEDVMRDGIGLTRRQFGPFTLGVPTTNEEAGS